MTPLQQAAQAVITRWDTSDWKSTRHTAEYITDLRKAIEAEQAQAVEHYMCGYDVTTGICTSNPCCYANADPAPPPAMHLSEILAERGITLQKTFVAKPRDHIVDAGKTMGERAELIARLIRKADAWDYLQPGATRLNACRQAADMLEADAASQARERHTRATLNKVLAGLNEAQQVAVPDGWALVPVEPTPAMSAAGFCVAEADHDPAGVYRAMLAAAQGAKP